MKAGSIKKLFYGLLVVLAWLSFVVEGSHALLNASAQLTGSSIASGTAQLQISNSQETDSALFADSRPGFAYALNPGETQERYLFLKNVSPANVTLDIGMVINVTDGVSNAMASMSYVRVVPVDANGVATGEGVAQSLTEYAKQGPVMLNLGIPQGEIRRFKVEVSLDSDWSVPGQAIHFDTVFIGVQHYG